MKNFPKTVAGPIFLMQDVVSSNSIPLQLFLIESIHCKDHRFVVRPVSSPELKDPNNLIIK